MFMRKLKHGVVRNESEKQAYRVEPINRCRVSLRMPSGQVSADVWYRTKPSFKADCRPSKTGGDRI